MVKALSKKPTRAKEYSLRVNRKSIQKNTLGDTLRVYEDRFSNLKYI